ncbi:serine hydrolase domain-containing protein [Actinacidiphila bryophytorum]|uniref:CubicO group peptidase, beta-lactamase class C family n=1 Tax=Actinacidiphila bryophytorum TaxID=1436133 RepID=A0A9W4H0I0_9ACTN|nr:serine hydrolase domain-containing protein [Actinacidiphila bryophytorum]MBM9438747.1 beta-lactamase family protein [Actinacidiphila bryophytorum]MBN6547994.1 beta-lactamase family protein [Actinacidiphila bryophytorum]CAG7637838.1 CubicO group peptidase, beta-lactamase class C family [Actinacidiphila bryophytorum]
MDVTEVQGAVEPGYEPVRAAFAGNFERRGDRGAAVAVYRRGRKVVDLWAGTAAPDGSGGPWRQDTAQTVRSATKGVAAACLLLLHQRGQLDLDAPVGAYWPEFKARGKERVTVRDVLAHRAGVPALDVPLTPGQALDGVSGPRAVAAQQPLFRPGVEHGYHAQTFSWLAGELVLRASGRSIGRFVAEEISRPLGLDLWIGLPEDRVGQVGRIADTEVPEPAVSGGLRTRAKQSVHDAYADPVSLTRRAFAAITPLPDENDPAYRAGELAASGGIATARSLARFYAALVGEPADGPRLFAPATVTAARTAESDGPDRVLVVNTRFGLGYMLHGPASPLLAPGSFGHPGRGGSLAFADPAAEVGFGYVTNGMQRNVTADPRAQALVRALRECIR